MASAASPFVLIRRVAPPAIALIVIAYFLGAAVFGDNGVMSWGEYRRQKVERDAMLSQLKAEQVQLQRRVSQLDPRQTDPDLAEEMTRRSLGVVRSDEVIVRIER